MRLDFNLLGLIYQNNLENDISILYYKSPNIKRIQIK